MQMEGRKNSKKGSQRGERGREGEEASTQKHTSSLPAPPTMGKRKEKQGRRRKEPREQGGRNNKRTKKRKYIQIIQSGKKSRWFLFLPTTKCTETEDTSGSNCRTHHKGTRHKHQAGGVGVASIRPGGHVRVPRACYAPGQKCICHGTHRAPALPCPAELPTRSCPP